MRKITIVVTIIIAALHLGFSQPNSFQTIRIKGSDTMRILLERLAEDYMKEHPRIAIFVEGGGTESGFEELIRNKIDICSASETIRPERVRSLAKSYNRIGVSTRVAKDALSVFINPQNPVRNLSMQQLESIFTGKIDNWKSVGGNDAAITVLIRPPNSGTFLFFNKHVLGGKSYSPTAKTMPTTMAITNAVLNDVNAIGYGGLAYGTNIIQCRVNQVLPSEQSVKDDRYPLVRYLYFYTIDTPQGHIKAFIDWVLKDGQKIVREVGYVPLWNE